MHQSDAKGTLREKVFANWGTAKIIVILCYLVVLKTGTSSAISCSLLSFINQLRCMKNAIKR